LPATDLRRRQQSYEKKTNHCHSITRGLLHTSPVTGHVSLSGGRNRQRRIMALNT